MKLAGQILKFIGIIWMILAGLAVLASMGAILYKDGIGKLFDLMEPGNFLNYFAILLFMAPGFGLYSWGKSLVDKAEYGE